jgi:hypothetical protein
MMLERIQRCKYTLDTLHRDDVSGRFHKVMLPDPRLAPLENYFTLETRFESSGSCVAFCTRH